MPHRLCPLLTGTKPTRHGMRATQAKVALCRMACPAATQSTSTPAPTVITMLAQSTRRCRASVGSLQKASCIQPSSSRMARDSQVCAVSSNLQAGWQGPGGQSWSSWFYCTCCYACSCSKPHRALDGYTGTSTTPLWWQTYGSMQSQNSYQMPCTGHGLQNLGCHGLSRGQPHPQPAQCCSKYNYLPMH